MKGEITRLDKFVKLMEKSNSCLFLWHELLRTFITKTNKKFAHLHGFLDDLANSSDEELDALNLSKSRKSSQYILTNFDSMKDTGDQKASMFAKKLKKQKNSTFLHDPELIDNTFNFLGGPSVKLEEFKGSELNGMPLYKTLLLMNLVSFLLDEFLKYLLLVLLNWATFLKKYRIFILNNSNNTRVMKKYQSAYRFLLLADKIAQGAETSLVIIIIKEYNW